MIGKDFIITRTKCLLNEFIAPIAEKTDKPRQIFLHRAVKSKDSHEWRSVKQHV